MNESAPGVRVDFVERASARLIVCTPTATFDGMFHYPIAARLSDAIRAAFTIDHHFLLTDVSSNNASLSESASRAPFVCINADHVNVAIPVIETASSEAEEPPPAETGDAPQPPPRLLKDFAA